MDEEKEESTTIKNKIINMEIQLYESYQDHSWLFSIKNNKDVLTVDTSISKEDCIKIAENIEYY